MSQQQWPSLLAIILGAGLFIAIIWSAFFYVADERLQKAQLSYQRGEKASTIANQEENFNRALDLYQQLANEYPTPSGQGLLYYNIANSYFQLQQYPWAVLYYYKALQADSNNEDIRRNLQITLDKLGLPPPPSPGWEHYILGGLTLPQRWQLMAFLMIAAGLLASVYIWKNIPILKSAAIIVGILAGLCLLSITYSAWFTAAEVIVLRATFLYRDAGKQYAKVLDNPLSPGLKLYLIDLEAEKPWAKVRTPQGATGYVPVDRIGTI